MYNFDYECGQKSFQCNRKMPGTFRAADRGESSQQPVAHWAVECSVTERKPVSSDDVGNGIKGKFGDITIIRSQIIVLK